MYYPALPGYLGVISPEVVYAELFAVQTGAIEMAKHERLETNLDPNKLIYDLEAATRQEPFDPSVLTVIRETKDNLNILHANEIRDYLKLKHLRSCLMLSTRACWMWLEDKIPSYVSAFPTSIFNGQECWLVFLIRGAVAFLNDSGVYADFVPLDYGVFTAGLQSARLDLREYPYNNRDSSSFRSAVMRLVHDVVGIWLQYPRDGNSYWKAVYVDVICRSIGIEPLVLDCVWRVYSIASQKTIGNQIKTPLGLDINTNAYPLFNRDSQLRTDLQQLSTIVFAFATGSQDVPDNQVLHNATPAQYVATIADKQLALFRTFIEDCFYFHFEGRPTHTSGLDELLEHEGDKYLPFREHAPTREHIKAPGGPFSPEHVRTIEGVFSAVVNRVITFNTKFSREGRTLFTSPTDFYRAVDDMGYSNVVDYFNKAAYGQNNSRKRLDLVDQYWDEVEKEPRWPGLESSSPIPFMKCFDYFFPHGTRSRFLQIGKLGAYLLTADYVYAGVVEPPSLDIVSNMIRKINKGLVSAFEILGMAPQRTKSRHGDKHQTTVKSFETQLKAVHQVVESSIPLDAHDDIPVDYILTEHAMCKFARLTSGKKPLLRIN